MGRHRRTPTPAPDPAAHGGHRGTSRRAVAVPVRTGLMGVSAAMAMGAVAVASGLIPGPGDLGSTQGSGDRVRADGPPGVDPPVRPSARATEPSGPLDRDPGGTSRDEKRSDAPSARPAESPGESGPETGTAPSRPSGQQHEGDAGNAGAQPSRTEPADDGHSSGPEPDASPRGSDADPSKSPDAETAAEADILTLVNQERSSAGCEAVTADAELAELAAGFSEDMADRGFFSHTSPDGKSPWDRAGDMDITDLGGENIARGQTDARSVMDTWMDSPGHRANILNCDYRSMGVGAHFAEGGPWWTQDFGF